MRRKSNGFYAIILFFGGIFSSAIGDVIAALMPDGVVKQFFLRHLIDFQFGPATLDINLLSFTLGFSLNLNIVGILGIAVLAYLLRWMD
jgi:hypothetical protein